MNQKTRREAKVLLDHCIQQRKVVPKVSRIGTRNWDELGEQIRLLEYYLNTGDVSNMDEYFQDITNVFALWLLGYNTTLDYLVEELLSDEVVIDDRD